MDFLPQDYAMIIARLLLAAALSGLIGMERESKQVPAGLRTHLLVGTGACLMMILSVTGFDAFLSGGSEFVRFDPSRIPSYVISGIGFLGAGTILVHRGSIRGLTTAASIWVAAGIGLVAGIGMYFVAILATAIVLITLNILEKIEKKYLPSHNRKGIIVIAEDRDNTLSELQRLFDEAGVEIMDVHIDLVEPYSSRRLSEYTFMIQESSVDKELELLKKLQQHDVVTNLKI